MEDFLTRTYGNNTVQNYLIFLLSVIITVLVILALKHLLLKRLSAWAEKSSVQYADTMVRALHKYMMPLIYLLAIYLNTKILNLGIVLTKIMNLVVLALAMILGASLVSSFLSFLFEKYQEKRDATVNRMALKIISKVIQALVWTVAVLLFLENIHVEISTLVASLGIGSVAIAFAAQAVLEDFFSFFAIFFDKPFEVGDFITVGDMMGTVEHIGIKTTRVRSLSGEQLIFSNKDLTSSRVKNFKRMENRRVSFRLKVTYDTPQDKLKAIPGLVKAIIDSIPDIRFDRAHLCELASFSLDFEVVYIVLSSDYNKFMDIQQDIYLRLIEEFQREGIHFAFPTQTLHLQNTESDKH